MKIYIAHSREFDFIDELYKPIRASKLNAEYTFILPHEEKTDKNNKVELEESHLIIAEVSFPSTGLGIELGWASIKNIPIICISREGCKISSSLNYVTKDFVTYFDPTDMIAKISSFLTGQPKNR